MRGEDTTGSLAERPTSELRPEFNPAIVPIRNYAAAVQSGDVQQIRRVYSGLTAREQQSWERIFKEYKVKASVQALRGLPNSTTTGITVVQFEMPVTLIHPTTLSQISVTRYKYRAWLRRQAQTLSIEKLELIRP